MTYNPFNYLIKQGLQAEVDEWLKKGNHKPLLNAILNLDVPEGQKDRLISECGLPQPKIVVCPDDAPMYLWKIAIYLITMAIMIAITVYGIHLLENI